METNNQGGKEQQGWDEQTGLDEINRLGTDEGGVVGRSPLFGSSISMRLYRICLGKEFN